MLVGIGFFCLFFLSGCTKEPPISEETTIPTVKVKEIEPKTLYPSLEFTGSVVSQEIARILPQVSGTVQRVSVRVGDAVRKGQTLIELDPVDYRYRLRIAEAESLKASAEYHRILRGFRPEDIEAKRNVYKNALAIFRSKNRNLERNRALYNAGTITERDWTVFLENLAAASAMVGKVSAELTKMEQGYESYDIQEASAALLLARANEALAQRNLDHTRITSPIDGVVSMRDVEIGQLVYSQQMLLEIQNPDRVWLLANASAKDANLVRIGQEAELYSDTLKGSQRGRVDRVSRVLDPNTKSLSIWFAWNETDHLPPIGSFAKGTLHLDPVPNVLALPRQWVHMEKGIHFVWAVEEGTLVRKNVAIAEDHGEEIVIQSGLETGTQLVISPPTAFEEGLAVHIEESDESPEPTDSSEPVISFLMQSSTSGTE